MMSMPAGKWFILDEKKNSFDLGLTANIFIFVRYNMEQIFFWFLVI